MDSFSKHTPLTFPKKKKKVEKIFGIRSGLNMNNLNQFESLEYESLESVYPGISNWSVQISNLSSIFIVL